MSAMDDDKPLTPEQTAMLADGLELQISDITALANGILVSVHTALECSPRNCWVHNPTLDWPLAGRPVFWSAERRLAYRACTHFDSAAIGTLHPDIDALAFANRYRTNYTGRVTRPTDPEWHPCDKCCREVDE